MVYGSFLGDSLALGVHWIYNVRAIEKRVGRIDDLLTPVVKTFHPNRGAGQFTHYGDQMLLLLSFCAEQCSHSLAGPGSSGDGQAHSSSDAQEKTEPKNFDRSAFLSRWAGFMESYDGYMDKASKATLASYREYPEEERKGLSFEAGSTIDDLAGASRIAPLLYFFKDNRNAAVEAAKAQASVTHNEPSVLESAAFFADLTLRALSGESPKKAARSLAEGHYSEGEIAPLVFRGLESEGKNTIETIGNFGQACSVEMGMPGVMHLIASYEDDLKKALVESTIAGGDSAARNHAVGMVLGAYLGIEDLPQKWFEKLEAREEIETFF